LKGTTRLLIGSGLCALIVTAAIGTWSPAHAAGFATSGVGIKARAMGGAFRGIADDWSAAAYNPAGLAFLERNEMNLSLGIYNPRVTYTPNVQPSGVNIGFDEVNGLDVPPIDDVWPIPSMAGIWVPEDMEGTAFGLAIYWPHDVNYGWDLYRQPPSYDSDYDYTRENYRTDLDVLDIHPVFARRLSESFSIGAGLSLTRGDLVYRRILFVENTLGWPYDVQPYDNFVGDLWMEGNGFSVGGNLGIMWKPSASFSLGVSFQTPVRVPLEGNAELNMAWPRNLELANDQLTQDKDGDNKSDFNRTVYVGNKDVSRGAPSYSSTRWSFDLNLPAQFGAGIGWSASERVTFAFDLAMTFWSSVDEWSVTFTDGGLLTNVDSLPPVTTLVVPFNWEDQLRLSGGTEYWARENLILRGGLYWESGAAVDETFTPNFPDVGDRVGVTGGFSYAIEDRWEIAAAQEITFFSERTVESQGGADGVSAFPGDYSLTRWETLVSLRFRF